MRLRTEKLLWAMFLAAVLFLLMLALACLVAWLIAHPWGWLAVAYVVVVVLIYKWV